MDDAATRTGAQSVSESQPALAAASAAVLLALGAGAALAGSASAQVLMDPIWGSEVLTEAVTFPWF